MRVQNPPHSVSLSVPVHNGSLTLRRSLRGIHEVMTDHLIVICLTPADVACPSVLISVAVNICQLLGCFSSLLASERCRLILRQRFSYGSHDLYFTLVLFHMQIAGCFSVSPTSSEYSLLNSFSLKSVLENKKWGFGSTRCHDDCEKSFSFPGGLA